MDLLFASSGIEPEIVQASETLELFPGQRIKVALSGHLIAVKLLARSAERPQDDVDLRALLAVCDATEMKRAVDAVEVIERRGFARGRDLSSALKQIVG